MITFNLFWVFYGHILWFLCEKRKLNIEIRIWMSVTRVKTTLYFSLGFVLCYVLKLPFSSVKKESKQAKLAFHLRYPTRRDQEANFKPKTIERLSSHFFRYDLDFDQDPLPRQHPSENESTFWCTSEHFYHVICIAWYAPSPCRCENTNKSKLAYIYRW